MAAAVRRALESMFVASNNCSALLLRLPIVTAQSLAKRSSSSGDGFNKGLPLFEYEEDYESSRKPLSHLVDVDRQKLSPYPHLSREDLEHPPPKVSDEVFQILLQTKPSYVNGKWRAPALKARELAKLRRKYMMGGHYWPEVPMRDLFNERTPRGSERELKKIERVKRIEESMKKMPDLIAAYRQRVYDERCEKRKQKEKQELSKIEGQRRGYHPKDPRLLMLLQDGEGGRARKKKKFQQKDGKQGKNKQSK